MAVLTAAQRKKIPAKEFGEPGERKYPMPDKSHAANAKSRAKQQLNKGNLSQEQRLRAEIERLRNALETIADIFPENHTAAAIARRALEEK